MVINFGWSAGGATEPEVLILMALRIYHDNCMNFVLEVHYLRTASLKPICLFAVRFSPSLIISTVMKRTECMSYTSVLKNVFHSK